MESTPTKAERLGAAGVAILGIVALLYALLGKPSYSYFGIMKFVVLVACIWPVPVLWRLSKATAPVVMALVVLSFVEMTGKMQRDEWVPWNWATIASLALSALILSMWQTKSGSPQVAGRVGEDKD
ncbi:MAG: hypothetical protein JSS65_07065 [Armatimonadetes bacterium]|nr:hypothetical protein [Armatimonadota bacterium]